MTDVVIFEGVNDIGGIRDDGSKTVAKLTEYYALFAKKAKERGMKVWGATIMPFKNSFMKGESMEKARQKVNEWVRASADYDGYIDFDKATRDPNDPEALRQDLQSDWLHPNAEGYKVMGQCAAKVLK